MDKFIFHLPQWDGKTYFTQNIILFLIEIMILMVGVLLCFWGYKYFKTLCMVIIGGLTAEVCIKIAEDMSSSLIIKMIIFVTLTFFGCCLFAFLVSLLDILLNRAGILQFIKKRICEISCGTGAGIILIMIYLFVYKSILVSGIVCIIFFLFGLFYQKKNIKIRPVFHSYEDIFKRKPLNEK